MRIAILELLAYGPFRGHVLDFSRPGLHVVYGRNEAGKSTTLRAITGLLYGIDAKTPDAHVHKFGDLRIGGVLENAAGERARVVRRKGIANTLLDAQEQVLDESVVRRFLGGVSRETFRHAFGLDHDTLEAGARALLDGKGDLGESLFDASVGGGGEVQRLVAELSAEADKLYKPRASSLPLNDALKAFAEAQKLVRERQSLPEAFLTQVSGLEEATRDRDERKTARAELSRKRDRFERVKQRVPLERRRERALEKRRELGSLADHGARVETLKDRFSAYERSVEQRRAHQAEASLLADGVAQAARRAGLDPGASADRLRLDARREARVQKLLGDRTRLALLIQEARKNDGKAERELARLDADDAQPSIAAPTRCDDGAELRAALERARALGDIEARVVASRTRSERKRTELVRRVAALGLWSGAKAAAVDLDAFVALRLPAVASVERLGTRADDLEQAIARLRERVSDRDREAASIERQIAAQTGDFAPPEAAELGAARAARDAAWKTLAAVEEPALFRARAAELELERLLRDADAVADRMIREADRVTILARLRSEASSSQRQRAKLAEETAIAQAERAALDQELAVLFDGAGIAPAGFSEMTQWLAQHRQLAEAHAGLRENLHDLADEEERAEHARVELGTALGSARDGRSAGDPARLADLVLAASRRITEIEAARRASEDAAKAIAKLRAGRDELAASRAEDERALADVEQKLAELLTPLGIPADASAEEVRQSIEALRDLFAVTDKRTDTEARARQADADARGFEEDLRRVLAELAPDLAASAPELAGAAVALFQRGAQAAELARELGEIEAQLESSRDVVPTDAERDLVADVDRAQAYDHELAEQLDELEREVSRLEQSIGGYKKGLDEMRVESNAAEAAALAQAELARVRENAERWCRAKLAMVIVSREIERYRDENQGPLLAASSSLFTRLTLGAFVGIKAGFDDKDKPCLRCVRAEGGAEVDVTGLSDGTRDQLYLSLRLASLLRRAEVADPMPLVLDDVLIQLDDQRAAAALSVLAEVAQRIQVLFFTHHARLVDLARGAVPADALVVHDLANAAGANAAAGAASDISPRA